MSEYVSWSDRYQNFVIVDGNGRQQFTADQRPLVFTTRAAAYEAVMAREAVVVR